MTLHGFSSSSWMITRNRCGDESMPWADIDMSREHIIETMKLGNRTVKIVSSLLIWELCTKRVPQKNFNTYKVRATVRNWQKTSCAQSHTLHRYQQTQLEAQCFRNLIHTVNWSVSCYQHHNMSTFSLSPFSFLTTMETPALELLLSVNFSLQSSNNKHLKTIKNFLQLRYTRQK